MLCPFLTVRYPFVGMRCSFLAVRYPFGP
jgi:hypothetical protein